MGEYVDLTRIIEDDQPVYPGDDKTLLRRTRNLDKDGFNNHRLEISMHSGTHIDGPMHLTDSKQHIDQIPLERFIGVGVLLDVTGEVEINLREEYESRVPQESVVLFRTGRDTLFGSEDYFLKNPYLSRELVDLLIEKKVKLVGFDSSSPDRYPYDTHRSFFEHGILIVENLMGLGKLPKDNLFEVIALPLKIHADSSPARVIAKIG